jgi:hypothetical protein
MTFWKDITPSTREFTDASYKRLSTATEYLWTADQKEKIEVKRKKKEEDEKARRHRDMEERRRPKTL